MDLRNFEMEKTTVWSFAERGNWATHSGNYRGNWSPYVPRNLLLRYSKEGDWVLDQFVGSGTTLVEAKLLNRNAIGLDINTHAVELTNKNLSFETDSQNEVTAKLGDATDLSALDDEEIDFICTHPPYANIIKYSDGIGGDLSLLDTEEFLEKMRKVSREAYRVLKCKGNCAIMMGDIRRHGKVVPLGFRTMEVFLDAGFKNKEIIIREQHNCRSTSYWEKRKNNFLLLAHEYIFVFEK